MKRTHKPDCENAREKDAAFWVTCECRRVTDGGADVLAVEERAGGYAVVDALGSVIALCIQRDPHPIRGNGISHELARRRAEACATALARVQGGAG